MIALPHLAEIERHLAQLSLLADGIEGRGARLHPRVRDWIAEAEAIFKRHAMPQAGDLAVVRTELALATRFEKPSGATGPARSRRSRSEQAAAEAMAKAARIVTDTIAPSRQLAQEGERIARQIASVASVKGHPGVASADWGAVSTCWEAAAHDPDLVSAAAHLVGLVGRTNAMMLFVRARTEV